MRPLFRVYTEPYDELVSVCVQYTLVRSIILFSKLREPRFKDLTDGTD